MASNMFGNVNIVAVLEQFFDVLQETSLCFEISSLLVCTCKLYNLVKWCSSK